MIERKIKKLTNEEKLEKKDNQNKMKNDKLEKDIKLKRMLCSIDAPMLSTVF